MTAISPSLGGSLPPHVNLDDHKSMYSNVELFVLFAYPESAI
jgi:hypothetical protein